MSARIPSRRLGQSALAVLHAQYPRGAPSAAFSVSAWRSLSNPFRSKPKDAEEDLTNPLLEQHLKRTEAEEGRGTDQKKKRQAQLKLREGSMNQNRNSLFRPEYEIPGWSPSLPAQRQAEIKAQVEARTAAVKAIHERKLSELNTDPDPRARRRLQRRLVTKGVMRHGRLTKAENVARTERQSVYKSHALPTSTKKLQKVVNQIAGKTVSDALVQLRFSKKRIARDVIKGLEIAQNEAIVGRGMGLEGCRSAQGRGRRQQKQSIMIELKDGSKKLVRNPSEIYVDQAWVGKGDTWKSPEFRARGRINMLRHRTTSFTVLLKEEKTRIRISEEIKKKRDNRKLWTALPDRPVTAQRQYCLW